MPHTGQYFATGLPEFDYDAAATCPTWDRCVGEWLDSSYHDTLHEFMGYVMTPDTSQDKLLAAIGVRRGGKSTTLQVMSWLVGAAHVVSRTLNDLGGDFGLEGTLDKKLMIIPDASDTELSKRSTALDRIKSITGRDDVSVNRKGVKIVSAKLPTRLALAANRHPKFLDDSGALNARELILVFDRSFEGKEDRDLSSKLRAELPGIANRALEGLRRLRANGRFTVGEKGLAAARELAESQSPALRFAHARLNVTGDADDFTPLGAVFESYTEWAVFSEELGSRERRNRDDFKNDLVAALMSKGVRYDRRRWRDPDAGKHGNAPRVRGFIGITMKAG
jgi:phage/plasmid-associated DNA primase